MSEQQPVESEIVQPNEKVAMNKRLETIGWGLFLIMLGGFALVPDDKIPKGLWSIGMGVILLGLNLARYYFKIKMSGFTTFLGVLALVLGVAQLIVKNDDLDLAFFLIILGAYLLLKPFFDKKQVFGKAEEG